MNDRPVTQVVAGPYVDLGSVLELIDELHVAWVVDHFNKGSIPAVCFEDGYIAAGFFTVGHHRDVVEEMVGDKLNDLLLVVVVLRVKIRGAGSGISRQPSVL